MLQLCWVKGVCMFRCNLPSALLAEWLGSFTCHCGNMGVEQIPHKSQQTKITSPALLPTILKLQINSHHQCLQPLTVLLVPCCAHNTCTTVMWHKNLSNTPSIWPDSLSAPDRTVSQVCPGGFVKRTNDQSCVPASICSVHPDQMLDRSKNHLILREVTTVLTITCFLSWQCCNTKVTFNTLLLCLPDQ